MFVVFEGIDGSGKTTISNAVVRRLTERGLLTCHLRQNGKFASNVTEAVRTLARDSRNLTLVPEAELLLYAAREVQLTEEVLRPALAAGKLVIADRYLYTPEVLGRFGRGLDAEWVSSLLKLVGRGLVPDLVVLVDVEPAVARARRKASKVHEPTSKPPSRKGLAGAGLAQRLRAGYLQLAAAQPERFAVVDNDADLETSVARVQQLIEASVGRGVSQALSEFRASSAPRDSAGGASTSSCGSLPEALERFLHKVSTRARLEPSVAAFLLTGFHGPHVDAMRRDLATSSPRVVLHALTALRDSVSFELRGRLADGYPAEVAASLAGVGNDVALAREFRSALRARAGAEVASSLRGQQDDESFQIREELFESFAEAVTESLAGLGDARAWRLRERFLDGFRGRQLSESPELGAVVMRAVRGLDDARAWALRDTCWSTAPVAVLRSLHGLDDDRSWQLREAHLERAPRPVLESLAALRTPRAWSLRDQAAPVAKEALDGIAGADVAEAWALRDRYADLWPSTVVKSLGLLRDSDRRQALLRRQLSLHGHELGVLRNAAALALDLWSEPAFAALLSQRTDPSFGD